MAYHKAQNKYIAVNQIYKSILLYIIFVVFFWGGEGREERADTRKVFLRYLLNKICSSNFTQLNFNNMHIG